MRKKRVTPNIYHYNLLLRAVRDCKLGSALEANKLLKPPMKMLESMTTTTTAGKNEMHLDVRTYKGDDNMSDNRMHRQQKRVDDVLEPLACDEVPTRNGHHDKNVDMQQQIVENSTVNDVKIRDYNSNNRSESAALMDANDEFNVEHIQIQPLVAVEQDRYKRIGINDKPRYDEVSVMNLSVPNILNPRPQPSPTLIDVTALESPSSRLALIGGLPGFLSHMKHDKVSAIYYVLIIIYG